MIFEIFKFDIDEKNFDDENDNFDVKIFLLLINHLQIQLIF